MACLIQVLSRSVITVLMVFCFLAQALQVYMLYVSAFVHVFQCQENKSNCVRAKGNKLCFYTAFTLKQFQITGFFLFRLQNHNQGSNKQINCFMC